VGRHPSQGSRERVGAEGLSVRRNNSADSVATSILTGERRGRFGNAALEQLGELLGNYRPTEIVSLRFVTVVSLKKFQLF
jgi:hypothetical protein